MSYEGQVVDSSSSVWQTLWAIDVPDAEHQAKLLEREMQREMPGGNWSIGVKPGRLFLRIDSTVTYVNSLQRRHTLFKTWLEPTSHTSDSFTWDQERMEAVWRRLALPLPERVGEQRPVPSEPPSI